MKDYITYIYFDIFEDENKQYERLSYLKKKIKKQL